MYLYLIPVNRQSDYFEARCEMMLDEASKNISLSDLSNIIPCVIEHNTMPCGDMLQVNLSYINIFSPDYCMGVDIRISWRRPSDDIKNFNDFMLRAQNIITSLYRRYGCKEQSLNVRLSGHCLDMMSIRKCILPSGVR